MVNQLSIYLINNFYQYFIFLSYSLQQFQYYTNLINTSHQNIRISKTFDQFRLIKLQIIKTTQMETNGVNYYKGVLLCSRPNESPSIPKQKPFCGRVTPQDALGLIPCKKFDQHQVRKRNLPVLNNHKKWLEGFKKKIVDQKNQEEQEKRKEAQRLQKIKQQGVKRRQMFKKSEFTTTAQANPFDETNNNNQGNKKQNVSIKETKVQKSYENNNKYKQSAKQTKDQQQQEIDELLDFFDKDDVKDYLQDQQVNRMLKDLKSRIQQMKIQGTKNGDWKKKQVQKIQQAKQVKIERSDSDKQKKDDILSRISRNSEAKSMASQKTTERVQQLQRKKKEKEWDKNTVSQKKSQAASVDLQIAKNVADEVLRNYPHLKHHSNQSIRKLLEKQAHQQIKRQHNNNSHQLKQKSQEYIGMLQNSEIETPNGQSLFAQEQDISPAERALLERVLALSLQDESNKAYKKNSGLNPKYRKLIASMRMTKSSQKCTICYSNFAENQIIKKMPCKHIYHRDCAKSWLKINHKCPNCRLDLQSHFQNLEKLGQLPPTQAPTCKANKLKQEIKHIAQNQTKST